MLTVDTGARVAHTWPSWFSCVGWLCAVPAVCVAAEAIGEVLLGLRFSTFHDVNRGLLLTSALLLYLAHIWVVVAGALFVKAHSRGEFRATAAKTLLFALLAGSLGTIWILKWATTPQ
jgi:hypothetical protein